LCAVIVSDETDALNETSGGNAPNTEASEASKPKLRLLCNPQSLPNPYLPKMEEYDRTRESTEIRRQLKEYFWLQRFKKPTKTRRKD